MSRRPLPFLSMTALSLAGLATWGTATFVTGCGTAGDVASESSARVETNVACPFLRPTKTGTRVTYSVKSSTRTSSFSRIETNKGLTDPENGRFASTSYDWEIQENDAADADAEKTLETIHVDSDRCSTARILESGASAETILDGAPEAGHKFETRMDGKNVVREWSGAAKSVTVPAGSFKQCWTLTTRVAGSDDVLSTEVHCKGVGLVKADFVKTKAVRTMLDAGVAADAETTDADDPSANGADAGTSASEDAGSADGASARQAVSEEHWELARHSWAVGDDDDDAGEAGTTSARDGGADGASDGASAEGSTTSATLDGGAATDAALADGSAEAGRSSDGGDGGRSSGSSGGVNLPDDDEVDSRTGRTGSSQPQTPRTIGSSDDEETKASSNKFKNQQSRRSCTTGPVGADSDSPAAYAGLVFGMAMVLGRRRRPTRV